MTQKTEVKQLETQRAKAFALYLARCHARNNGKPLPGPESIQPVCFARVKPTMTREEQLDALNKSLAAQGIKVKNHDLR